MPWVAKTRSGRYFTGHFFSAAQRCAVHFDQRNWAAAMAHELRGLGARVVFVRKKKRHVCSHECACQVCP